MARSKQTERIVALGLIVLLIAGFPAMAKQRKPGESPEVRKIKAVLGHQVEAWNHHDLEGFMSGYWNSESLTFYSGGITAAGWKTTLDRYRSRYQGAGNEMGQLQFTDLQVEMLSPASAFVRGHWHLKMSASEPGGLFTLVFRKIEGQWKIVHDHTSTS